MVNLFTTASRYLCILLVVLYTYCNFRYLSIPDEEDAAPLCGWQFRIILLIHFLCHVVIFLKAQEMTVLPLYLAELAFLIGYPSIFRLLYRNMNRLLLNNLCLFISYGLIMLERLDMSKAIKQFAIIVGAAVLTLVIPFIIDRIWDLMRYRYVFAVVGIALLFPCFSSAQPAMARR